MKRETFFIDRRNTLEVTVWMDRVLFSVVRTPHQTANVRSRHEFELSGTELSGLVGFLLESSDG